MVFAAKKDPVVMTVGNQKVKLSEFEYLYKKNNAQNATDMTIDEYIGMFVNYKLKVCAALDAKLDTISSYRDDMAKYSDELAAPYMVDKEMLDSLLNVAYARMLEVVETQHIMLNHKTDSRSEVEQRLFADSIRNLVVNGADFDELVKKYSVDKTAARTGGYITVVGGNLLLELEDNIYNTPVGDVTAVVPSRVGLHIFKINDRYPHPGEVKARHLLLSTQGAPVSKHPQVYAKADSLRNVILAGADFQIVASQNTEDPSGHYSGGNLPWFGPGRMIKEFEKAAYELKDGEVSEPVKTAYGYHLILREGIRSIPPIDSVKNSLLARFKVDSRYNLAEKRAVERYAKDSKSKNDAKISGKVRKIVEKYGGLNEASRQKIMSIKDVAFIVDGEKYRPDVVLESLDTKNVTNCDSVMRLFDAALKNSFDKAVEDRMKVTLANREPAYGNLINEYSDGMLLYEISNREVWEKANTDIEGLEAYYFANKDSYKWDVPHYKGYVVCAESDSLLNQAVAYLVTLDGENVEYSKELRKKFGTTVRIEKVITAQGASPIVDYIAFGGSHPQVDRRWVAFAPFGGQVLEQPSSLADVKGEVSVDYQQFLEEEWVKELRQKYSVEINEDLIKESLAK